MTSERLRFQVVELMPPTIEDGVLYVSLEYMTAVHRCCCGCGEKVVTPISPTDWSVTFHGDSVTLHPSIGNWGLACRSHYFVRRGRVHWAPKWSKERIDAARRADHMSKQQQFGGDLSRSDSYSERARTEDKRTRKSWLGLRRGAPGRTSRLRGQR